MLGQYWASPAKRAAYSAAHHMPCQYRTWHSRRIGLRLRFLVFAFGAWRRRDLLSRVDAQPRQIVQALASAATSPQINRKTPQRAHKCAERAAVLIRKSRWLKSPARKNSPRSQREKKKKRRKATTSKENVIEPGAKLRWAFPDFSTILKDSA
eukprot:2763499-Rhodomonas_salina.1